jgi:hypothetical protein
MLGGCGGISHPATGVDISTIVVATHLCDKLTAYERELIGVV